MVFCLSSERRAALIFLWKIVSDAEQMRSVKQEESHVSFDFVVHRPGCGNRLVVESQCFQSLTWKSLSLGGQILALQQQHEKGSFHALIEGLVNVE